MKFNNKGDLNILREKINTALATVEKDLNINIGIGNISYSDNGCTTKVTCAAVRDDGLIMTKEAEDLGSTAASVFGDLSMADHGSHFILKGKGECRLTGFRSRARKYPYLCEVVANGEEIILSESYNIREAIDTYAGRKSERKEFSITPFEPVSSQG
tara:strand:+ start:1865 stop:2335 length:471 start_codon:yes stop_codon:yes gene_type:complete